MNYKRYDMNGYHLHMITTARFKTIYFAANFKRETQKEEITIRNFLSDMLTNTTKKYPTKRDLEIAVEDLYSLSAGSSSYITGNYDVISLSGTFLNEIYTEPGMNETSIAFLMDLLFDPNVENETFDESSFEYEKQLMQDDFESIKDNPNRYSKIRLHELMAPNLPIAFHGFGYEEDLPSITRENLYQYYKSVLENDVVDIFLVGNFEPQEMKSLIEKYVPLVRSQRESGSHFVELPIHDEVVISKETLPLKQSRLALGLKTESLTDLERKYILNVYSFILGGGSDSKLFANVREKNSLCYSIHATPTMLYGTVEISAGIEGKNYEKTVSLIKESIQEMKEGKISDQEFERTITTYLNGCKEVADSQQAIVSNYLSHEYLGNDLIEDKIEKIKSITKEDVIQFAQKVHLDTIFLLEGGSNEAITE